MKTATPEAAIDPTGFTPHAIHRTQSVALV